MTGAPWGGSRMNREFKNRKWGSNFLIVISFLTHFQLDPRACRWKFDKICCKTFSWVTLDFEKGVVILFIKLPISAQLGGRATESEIDANDFPQTIYLNFHNNWGPIHRILWVDWTGWLISNLTKLKTRDTHETKVLIQNACNPNFFPFFILHYSAVAVAVVVPLAWLFDFSPCQVYSHLTFLKIARHRTSISCCLFC